MSTWRHRIESLSHKQREILAKAINRPTESHRKMGAKRLAAFIVADQQIDAQELQNFLEERLPDYMRPSFIKQLDQLPRLPNGKLDTQQLNNSIDDLHTSVSHTTTPGSKTEKALVENLGKSTKSEPDKY